jgi:hypothetical protein
MLDWLKPLLGDAHTADIETKIEAEIGKHFAARADFNAANEAKKALETRVADRDKQLEDLKKASGDAAALKTQIEALQADNKAKDEAHKAQLLALRRDAALADAIRAAGGRNVKAVSALLDTGKITLGEDGKLAGLDLEAVKKSDPYLFGKAGEPAFPPPNPPPGDTQPKTLSGLTYAQQLKLKQDNPTLYNQLLKG